MAISHTHFELVRTSHPRSSNFTVSYVTVSQLNFKKIILRSKPNTEKVSSLTQDQCDGLVQPRYSHFVVSRKQALNCAPKILRDIPILRQK